LLDPQAVRFHHRFLALRFAVVELARRADTAPHTDDRLFVSHLVDLVTALLTARPSAETNRLARERPPPADPLTPARLRGPEEGRTCAGHLIGSKPLRPVGVGQRGRSVPRWWGRLAAMLETSARLLRLLSHLQARRDWTGPQLAERLGVTTRTVRNDIERLRSLGYPVDATPGVAGGYRLGTGAALPPLLLDDDEAVAVAIGLRTAAGSTIEGIEETSVRALAKVERLLPSRLRHRVGTLAAAVVALPPTGPAVPGRDPDRHRGRVPRPRTAALRLPRPCGLLEFTGGGAAPARPLREALVPAGVGCRPRGLAHVPGRPGPVAPAQRSPVHAPPALRRGGHRPDLTRPRHRDLALPGPVTVHAPAAVIATRLPAAITIEPLDAERCVIHVGSDNPAMLALYLGMLDADFTVDPVSAPELAEHLRTVAARYTRAAEERPQQSRLVGEHANPESTKGVGPRLEIHRGPTPMIVAVG
jgi:biotin operon repressor